jgi:hypothetical protein
MSVELETPVAEAASAAATSYPPSDTSHLRLVRLPAQDVAAVEESEVELTANGVKLPRTLKDSLEMLRGLRVQPIADKTEAKLHKAMMARLGAHIHGLSQGPTCKPILGKDHRAISAASSQNAEDIHLVLSARRDPVLARRLDEDAATIAGLNAKLAAWTGKTE